MKEILVKKSFESAKAFYEKVEREFIPAILSRDTEEGEGA